MNLHSLVKTAFYKAGYSIKRIRQIPRHSGAVQKHANTATPDVRQLLHKTDPYERFDYKTIPFDPQGWASQSPAFRDLISQVKPRLIVEVGTWKGASAFEMAGISRELNLSCQIVCVDTWLGALEFWTDQTDPDRYLSLQLRHGYPSIYYQFLANVCHQGFQDRIVPFPQTSSIAALWFRYFGITADLIYIDGSHEEEDVYRDICDYWEIVADGGILFGDDYAWDGVRLALTRFAKEEGLRISFASEKWVLKKQR